MKYEIVNRVKKRFFKKPVLVYDIAEHFKYWHDPSNGNGGGSFEKGSRVVASFNSEKEVVKFYKELTKNVRA